MDTPDQTPIDINTTQPAQTTPIDIDVDNNIPIPSISTAAERATKISMGLGPVLGKEYADLLPSLLSGQEPQIRTEAASKIDLTKTYQRQQAFQNLASRGVLNADNVNTVLPPLNPTNPKTVVEQAYGAVYANAPNQADTNWGDTFLADAKAEIPKQVAATQELAGTYIAKREFTNTVLQNLQEKMHAQSTGGYLADMAKSFVPGYAEIKLRGQVGNFFSGGLLGGNLDEQTRQLLMLPMDQFEKRLTEISDGLAKDNPQMAERFVSAVLGQSSSEKFANNAFTILDTSALAPLGKIGVGLAKKVAMYNQVRGAFKDVIKSVPSTAELPPNVLASGQAAAATGAKVEINGQVVKAAMATGAGDAQEAAAQTATNQVVKQLKGTTTPLKDAVESATSNFRTDLPAYVPPSEEPIAFKTAKGSTCVIQEDGTTIRNKSFHEGHVIDVEHPDGEIEKVPDIGFKLQSAKTVYVTDENANKLAQPQGRLRIIDHGDGTISTATPNPKTGWGIPPSARNVPYSTSPEVGMTPIELYTPGTTQGAKSFNSVRFGSKIVEVTKPDIVQPKASHFSHILSNLGRFGQEGANRLKEQYQNTQNNFLKAILESARVQRVPIEQATESQLKALERDTRDRYRGLNNNIFDVSEPRYEPISNTWYHSVSIRQNGSQLFRSFPEAQTFMKYRGILGGKIEKQGLGYYISTMHPIDETSDAMRDLIRDTAFAQAPKVGLVKSALSFLRTPDDTAAMHQTVQRKVATYAQAVLSKVRDAEAKQIDDFRHGRIRVDPVTGDPINWISREARSWKGVLGKNKDRWEDFQRLLKDDQDSIDPNTGREGRTFKTPGDLEDWYQRNAGRLPDSEEIMTYFAKKRLDELDRQVRNISEVRNRLRVGAQTHRVSVLDKDGNQVFSPFFDGVIRKKLPGGSDNILIMGKNVGEERLVPANGINPSIRKGLLEDVEQGRRTVIEVYAPERDELAGFSSEAGRGQTRYVVSDKIETKNLDWHQVPETGGGHFNYDHPVAIKQADIRTESSGDPAKPHVTHRYRGDNLFSFVPNQAMGKDIVGKMHKAMEMLRNKDFKGAKDFVRKELGMDGDEFEQSFRPKRDENGVVHPARYNLDEPFYVLNKGVSIKNYDKSLELRYPNTFKDGTKSGSLSQQYQVPYTKTRDAENVRVFHDTGTKGKPSYNLDIADKVDPITVMNRGLNDIVKSFYMDDMKVSGIENWIRNASPHLDAKENQLRFSPFHYFNDPPNWKSGTPKNIRWALEADRMKLLQFTGVPSKIDTFLNAAAQHLEDWRWSTFGNTGALAKTAMVPQWLLSRVKDPFSYARAMTYHAKLGLFALPQLIVQNMTYVTMFGITPRYTTSGLLGAFLHGWGRLNRNPGVIEHLDMLASKFHIPGLPQWKLGEFKEAFEHMEKTGFGHVGGEYINLDDMSSWKVTKNAGHTFLDWGQGFFKSAERNVRRGAWYTAFKEFRDVNPTGAITPAKLNGILERADLLYTNMSRASASTLHSGVFSLTSQFLSYQLRLAELMMGKRLAPTLAQRNIIRARTYGIYAAMFGAPTAMGISGLPIGDYLRSKAIEDGYVVGDKWWSSALNEGIPSMILALATGGGDMQKGNFYNVGNRYGAQGFEIVRKLIRSDAKFWDLVGGASFEVLSNTFSRFDGFTRAMISMGKNLAGYQDPNGLFKLTAQDFVDPLKEIQSVSAVWHAIAVYNTGKWMSNNEGFIQKSSVPNGIFQAASGLHPQAQDDMFLKRDFKKNEEDYQKWAMKEYVKEMHRGFDAFHNNDNEQGHAFFKRAQLYLIQSGFPPERYGSALKLAQKGYEDLIKTQDYDYYMKDIPVSSGKLWTTEGRRPAANEAMKTIRHLNDIRGQ